MKLLSRDDFRINVFTRDNWLCVYCGELAVDAHHIIERKLFADGGYYLDNGASLCSKCHIKAEKTEIECDTLRKAAGVKYKVYPQHFDPEFVYDKWGNIILEDGKRVKGELFESEQVQKSLEHILYQFVMSHQKYPRTPHLPWSEKLGKEDRMLDSVDQFVGKEVVVSVKLDGENTTMYSDHIHARSLDSKHHPSRDWVKGLWGGLAHNIPEGWRICGENMYAKHTIHYHYISSYFYVFSIWNSDNKALSWEDTLQWCELLGLTPVPVLYQGIFDYDHIRELYKSTYNGDPCEGYVIRLADSFHYEDFSESMGKFVSSKFLIGDTHWMHDKVTPNQIKADHTYDELIFSLRESTFHHSNEEAKPVIDGFLDEHPKLLDYHDREWYYKYC